MRKLASALGVEAMSLYNHVAGKDDVLDGLTGLFLARIEIPPPTGDWRTDLRALAAALRSAARRQPQAASLALTREAISEQGLAVTAAALEALGHAGFSYEEAVDAQRATTALLAGALLRELRASAAGSAVGPEAAAERESVLLASGLEPIVDAATQLAHLDFDREYDYSVELMLDALEARAASA